MAAMDFFTGVLPFVLTYVVLYAALDKVPVINEKDNFPPLIAIIGAFFVARFIVVNPVSQSLFVEYFGRLVIGFTGFIGLLVLLAFTGYNLGESGGLKTPLVVMVMVAIVGSAFTTAGGLGFNPAMLSTPQLGALFTWLLESGALWILIVGGALWWATGDGSDEGMSFQDLARPAFSNAYWHNMMDDDD
jgi:hypothetical protein